MVSDKDKRVVAQAAVRAALGILKNSERGREVLEDLRPLLNGPLSGLDYDGWEAIDTLLLLYRGAWTGSVLEQVNADVPAAVCVKAAPGPADVVRPGRE